MEPIQSNKIYPIGIQNFEKMRKGGYFYVDKTALVYRLVKTGSYYFLSRPRRFGKSLLISTLEAYFQGKKEVGTHSCRTRQRGNPRWCTRELMGLYGAIEPGG